MAESIHDRHQVLAGGCTHASMSGISVSLTIVAVCMACFLNRHNLESFIFASGNQYICECSDAGEQDK